MSKLFTLCAAVAAALVATSVAAEDKAGLKLEGQYTVMSAERDGKAVPADELTGRTFRITAEKIVAADKDGKDVWAMTYTIDVSKTPAVLRLKGTGSEEGKEFTGLVERTANNEVRLIYNNEGGKAPTEFRTKDKQSMFVLVPQKK
jgi:uncharacterized protein (TIGR03067 family)